MGRAAITAVLVAALPVSAAELEGGADAGLGWADPLYATCPEAPPPDLVDGGWLFTPARASRTACLMATCDARRRTLEPIAAGPAPFSSGSLWVDLCIWALGVAAGLYLGFTLRGAFK